MINLIKNELFKLIHKRSTFVILIIMFAFVVLTNYVYTRIGNISYTEEYYSESYNEAVAFINNNEPSAINIDEYVYYQTIISTKELMDEYKEEWQLAAINDEIFSTYSELYMNEYYNNEKELVANQAMIDEMIQKLKDNDWKYFIDRKIAVLDAELDALKSIKYQEGSNKEKEYKKSIERNEIQKEILEYRKENDLPINGKTYLDDAIRTIEGTVPVVLEAKYDEKYDGTYDNAIKEYYNSRYVLDNKVDINNNATQRAIIIDFYSEYYFLILVFVIMIAGAIVSEEFNKGTVKSLLILPFSRTKILLAKFISTIIMLLFGIAAMFIMQMLVGGIFFGYSSLSIPFVTYNVTTKSMVEISVFAQFGLMTLAMLPKLLLLGTLAFALSTVFANTAAAIAVTFCGYIGEAIINMLAIRYQVKFLNYFVTTNWNFNELLFGGKSQFGLSLTHGIIICAIYFIFMIIVAFIVFNKKDIKNI